MRNRAAVWGWGALAVAVILLILFGSRSVVGYLGLLRGGQVEKIEIPAVADESSEKKIGRYVGLLAGVYSRYPFNERDFIFLNKGSENGVALSSPVVGERGELLGRVKEVTRTRSKVETFWSPTWKSAVYVGEQKIKAVLRGGEVPVLEFLPKNSGIKAGDFIYNASPDFPLYAPIGVISEVAGSDQNPWLNAELNTSIEPAALREAWVLKDFP